MHFSDWLVFCAVGLLVSFTPGPAVLLAVSNSITVGSRRAMISSMGNALGLVIVATMATVGLGVVLSTSAAAFMLLKLAGAVYLVYLGIRQWRRKTSAFSVLPACSAAPAAAPSDWRLFGHGFTVALTNPKSILFFSALFPQFLKADAPALDQFAMLTTTYALCTVVSHASYALLARGMKRQFDDARRLRLFNRVSGGAFVVFGLGLLRLRHKTG